jgi:hypothetical protein
VLLIQNFAGEKIGMNEMGRAYSENGVGRSVYRILGRHLRERDHRGYQGVDWKIVLKWISRKWNVGLWTGLS